MNRSVRRSLEDALDELAQPTGGKITPRLVDVAYVIAEKRHEEFDDSASLKMHIAQRLQISAHTAHHHIAALREATGLRSWRAIQIFCRTALLSAADADSPESLMK